MIARRDVFQAIADPTRRQIIDLVAQEKLNVNAIAEKFEMTRQAISLHLKILAECGLVEISQQGRDRYCDANLNKLQEVADWIGQYRTFWDKQFNYLDNYLNQIKSKNKKHGK